MACLVASERQAGVSLQFKLHIIPPPYPLDWSSPRSLLIKTLVNHFIQDPAPIGHFFIEIESEVQNPFGVRHVLTGMSRLKKNASTLAVIRKQVGLGTFFYDFEGKLDQAARAKSQLDWAKKRKRLKTISVTLTEERAKLLMDELGVWISEGSFKHYGGGGLSILKGEGSGCAEFGMHFFNLALGKSAAHPDWIRTVYSPKPLTGGELTQKKVTLTKVFLKGEEWAKDENDGFLYATPDMELVTAWLEKNYPGKQEIALTAAAVTWAKSEAHRVLFQANYPKTSEPEIKLQWNRIGVKAP